MNRSSGPAPPLSPALAATAVLTASVLAWAVLFVSIPPARQNFPLNDDWAFARGAMLFARGQGIHYGGWASMPQLGQWLWAVPFLGLLGESHVALRISTLVLSWVGLWAFFDLLRGRGVSTPRAALASLSLAVNPLFFLLQGTFMTDVPALSFSLAALAMYTRALRSRGLGWWAGGVAVALLAVLTRQNTLGVAATAAVLLWLEPDLRRRPVWWLGVAVPVAAGLAVHFWFQGRHDVRALSPGVPQLSDLLLLPFLLIHFCGLSALPLLVLRGPGGWRSTAAAFAALAGCALWWLYHDNLLPYGGLFPYAENMLSPWGAFAGSKFTGPLVVGVRPVLLDTPLRGLLSLLGCVAGAFLLARAVRLKPRAFLDPLLLFTAFQLPFLVIVPDFYDRYLLFLLPGALRLACTGAEDTATEPVPRVVAGWGVALLLGVASVGLMHDWLAWNAARWALGERAVARQVAPLRIEGGVEWDGWYSPPGDLPQAPRRWPVLKFTQEWFAAVQGQHALSFSDLPGTRRVDTEPYTFWLLPGPRQFFLLEIPPLPPAREANPPTGTTPQPSGNEPRRP